MSEKELKGRDPGVKHVFDDIEELDNRLPNWWLGILWGSILFAFGYWFYYHPGGLGPSQAQVYEQELAALNAKREAQKQEALAKLGDRDPFEVLLADKDAMAAAAEAYAQTCAACHGPEGGGIIGPNLTDNHYLHGKTAKEIHEVITTGVVEKGMPGWEPVLGAEKVNQLTAYVVSLQGKNVAGKEPQGELIE